MRKLLLLLLILITSSLSALDVSADFSMGNLIFPSNFVEGATAFTGDAYPWGLNLTVAHELSDNASIKAGFLSDPILKNIIFTEVLYQEDFFTIGVGPFFGAFNSATMILNSGLSMSIKVQIPGILFFNFRTDNSIGTRMIEPGNYLQTRNEILFGFYVPNAICSIYMNTKDYVTVTPTGEIQDSMADYVFSVEMFQKNVPYKVDLRFGYEHLSKSYFTGATLTAEHVIGSILVGLKFDMQIVDFFGFYIDMDTNVYAFGYNTAGLLSIPTTGVHSFLFRAKAGFRIDIDKIIQSNNVDDGAMIQ